MLQFRECACIFPFIICHYLGVEPSLFIDKLRFVACTLLGTEVILMLLFFWQMVLWITALHGLFLSGKQVIKAINTGLDVLQQHL